MVVVVCIVWLEPIGWSWGVLLVLFFFLVLFCSVKINEKYDVITIEYESQKLGDVSEWCGGGEDGHHKGVIGRELKCRRRWMMKAEKKDRRRFKWELCCGYLVAICRKRARDKEQLRKRDYSGFSCMVFYI